MNPEWIEDADAVPELVSLFLRCAGPVYICQAELLDGRADSVSSWSKDLRALLALEFLEAIESGRGSGRRKGGISSIRIDDAIRGFAFMEIFRTPGRRPYAFLHDIVVDPEVRGRGIGTALITWLKEELVREGITRIFLESGRDNHSAHAFFERHGFEKLSISMLAELGPASRPGISAVAPG
jgi:ribosomal protein S18 acetylase RimI-like enzyme